MSRTQAYLGIGILLLCVAIARYPFPFYEITPDQYIDLMSIVEKDQAYMSPQVRLAYIDKRITNSEYATLRMEYIRRKLGNTLKSQY